MAKTSARLPFGYWSDPLCIWAFVAQERLEGILQMHGDELDIDYRIAPVFGSVPWRFEDGPWASAGAEGRVEATRRVARQFGHPEVTGEIWRSDPPASSWASGSAVKAVCALEAAAEIEPGTAPRFLWQMRCKLFVDNQNVARRSVQLALAEEMAIPRQGLERRLDDGTALASLFEDHQERERLKIQGSPTYVFDGGRTMLYGNFATPILHSTIEELVKGACPGGTVCS